ncbi:MAG TPA: hypothetical protein VF591_21860 [Pyrinomonadaceae bacterium]|jgi:hypothetical protein
MADEPARLSEMVASISVLYTDLRGLPGLENAKKLREGIKKFAQQLQSIRDELKLKDNEGEIKDAWEKDSINDRLERLRNFEKKFALVEGAPVELSQFFENVSGAVITAQRQLNRASEDYADDLARDHPQIPPAYYAIPGVKAEMKVGFNNLSQRGVNVIFFTNKEQKERYLESTITFEVVSVPAPLYSPPRGPLPAAFKPAGSLPPAPAPAPPGSAEVGPEPGEVGPLPEAALAPFEEPVEASPRVTGGEREAVLEQLTRRLEERGSPLGKLYENTRGRAVVLGYAGGPAARYLVIWPGARAGAAAESWGELSIFHLSGSEGELQLDGGVFDAPPEAGYLVITGKAGLKKMSKDGLCELVINLGDALVNVGFVFGG